MLDGAALSALAVLLMHCLRASALPRRRLAFNLDY